MPAIPEACTSVLPEEGLLRLSQIIGDKKRCIPPIIPVSRDKWYSMIREGRAPPPIKLGSRTSVWSVKSIRKFIDEMIENGGCDGQ